MKKIVIGFMILALVSCLMVNQARAERFKLAAIASSSVSAFDTIEKSSGMKLYSTVAKTEVGEEGVKKFVRFTHERTGKFDGSKVPLKSKTETYYYADPNLRPHYSKCEVFSQSGQLLKVQTANYDYAAKKVYITTENKIENKAKNNVINLENDTIDKYGLGLALQGYPYSEKRDFKFHYVSPEPSTYSLTMVYRGREKIGNVECHKLEMTIDLGLLGVVGAFIPKTYWWYSDEPVPQFVKYEGLDGSLGSAYIINQVVK